MVSNADGKGWLAYLNKEKGLLLVKQFEDLVAGQPAPDEAEIQVYVNRGKTYIELESQGAYTTLQPGEELQTSNGEERGERADPDDEAVLRSEGETS